MISELVQSQNVSTSQDSTDSQKVLKKWLSTKSYRWNVLQEYTNSKETLLLDKSHEVVLRVQNKCSLYAVLPFPNITSHKLLPKSGPKSYSFHSSQPLNTTYTLHA